MNKTLSYININLYEKFDYKTYRIVQGDKDLSFIYNAIMHTLGKVTILIDEKLIKMLQG